MQLAGNDNDLLVADIGGTNSRFAIASGDPGPACLRRVSRAANAGNPDFSAQLRGYLNTLDRPLPGRACIAVAGPTDGEHASLTNGTWEFDRQTLIADFGFADVLLINDFTALASSVCSLDAAHVQRIKPGQSVAAAPLCVIGPGTGLGVACVVSPGARQTVIATEGGHVDLAPVTAQEWSLKQWLRELTGVNVSAEHALCGEGLRRIDGFLRGQRQSLRAADTVTREALHDDSSAGRRAVSLFLTLLARFAGNTALAQGATGGVFLGGGILPRLLPVLDVDRFSLDFSDKGAMAAYCRTIPVDLITDTDASLRGAAIAFHQARGNTGR